MSRYIAMIAALFATTPALADDHLPRIPTLTITAEGHADRIPDIADISSGVVTVAPTAAAALAANAARMTAVVAAIRHAGIAERDIQTSGLSLQPQYHYDKDKPPVLTGYQTTNTVALRVRDLASTGRLVDALVAVGANQINGPNFRVEAADAALDEARTKAVVTARARAGLYANAAGLHVKRIVSIAESGGERFEHSIPMAATRLKMQTPTPVAPGEITLSADVTVIFELE